MPSGKWYGIRSGPLMKSQRCQVFFPQAISWPCSRKRKEILPPNGERQRPETLQSGKTEKRPNHKNTPKRQKQNSPNDKDMWFWQLRRFFMLQNRWLMDSFPLFYMLEPGTKRKISISLMGKRISFLSCFCVCRQYFCLPTAIPSPPAALFLPRLQLSPDGKNPLDLFK